MTPKMYRSISQRSQFGIITEFQRACSMRECIYGFVKIIYNIRRSLFIFKFI